VRNLHHFFLVFHLLDGPLLPLCLLLQAQNLGLELVDDGLVVGSVLSLVLGERNKNIEVGLLQELHLFLQHPHLHPESTLLLVWRVKGP
jgi:hypothetical protein